jgi:hypothetical protein
MIARTWGSGARGRFVLATNIDILFQMRLFFSCGTSYGPDVFIVRPLRRPCEYQQGCPSNVLDFCRQTFRIHATGFTLIGSQTAVDDPVLHCRDPGNNLEGKSKACGWSARHHSNLGFGQAADPHPGYQVKEYCDRFA